MKPRGRASGPPANSRKCGSRALPASTVEARTSEFGFGPTRCAWTRPTGQAGHAGRDSPLPVRCPVMHECNHHPGQPESRLVPGAHRDSHGPSLSSILDATSKRAPAIKKRAERIDVWIGRLLRSASPAFLTRLPIQRARRCRPPYDVNLKIVGSAGLQEAGRFLREEFGLARARACRNAHASRRIAQRLPRAGTKIGHPLRKPVFGTHRHQGAPFSRPRTDFTCLMSARGSGGAFAARSAAGMRSSAARCVSGLRGSRTGRDARRGTRPNQDRGDRHSRLS